MANLWQSFWRREPHGEKALSVALEPNGFVTEIRSYRRPGYPNADNEAIQATMSRNELVFACLGVKATAAIDPRLVVKVGRLRQGKLTYEEAPGHPLRQLIMRPNPGMTESDLMKAAIVSWDISNPRRFFAEKEYTNGRLTALWPLNPAMMRPRWSKTNSREQVGYVWDDYQGGRREYSFEELLIRSAPAWYEPCPVVAALGSVDIDSAQTDYVRAFFENGGMPPGILKYKNSNLRQEQRDEIRAKWMATYGNRYGRQFDIGVLDANVDYQETGSTLDKLQSEVLRSVAESRICMSFRVPPLIVYAYVGLIRATYSNLKEAWAGFWDATMSPSFKEWRDFWTWNLLTEFEEERDVRSEVVKLAYDFSEVAAYQEDVDARNARAEKSLRAGGITLNEYRSQIGQAPDPAGDYYLRLLSYAPQMAGQLPQVDADQALGGKRKQWQGWTKSRSSSSVQTIERRMEQALQKYLEAQYRKAAQNVRG